VYCSNSDLWYNHLQTYSSTKSAKYSGEYSSVLVIHLFLDALLYKLLSFILQAILDHSGVLVEIKSNADFSIILVMSLV
jgi:hypothetical protein